MDDPEMYMHHYARILPIVQMYFCSYTTCIETGTCTCSMARTVLFYYFRSYTKLIPFCTHFPIATKRTRLARTSARHGLQGCED